ncbi:unnamed protein product [Rangifer tarandus platyrhynchus]|uniref:Uncharacterized protein n=1 Tax=Rangifer tarandus platyrhynchus TaxID=3082113 RepID=A0ABN8ZAE7_RANTA|nr:unnamed protein product [Rangifer tarandus platyrhynchus]CAI9689203.1 unnamed protein product [Rangifer tarandus platyrhynchus]
MFGCSGRRQRHDWDVAQCVGTGGLLMMETAGDQKPRGFSENEAVILKEGAWESQLRDPAFEALLLLMGTLPDDTAGRISLKLANPLRSYCGWFSALYGMFKNQFMATAFRDRDNIQEQLRKTQRRVAPPSTSLEKAAATPASRAAGPRAHVLGRPPWPTRTVTRRLDEALCQKPRDLAFPRDGKNKGLLPAWPGLTLAHPLTPGRLQAE